MFIIVVGLPGAGKSTYIRETLQKENPLLNIVSTDDIREELGNVYDQSQNDEVFSIVRTRIAQHIAAGEDVVLDATNISSRDRNRMLGAIPGMQKVHKRCDVILCDFEHCLANQKKRTRKVPPTAIINMMKRFSVPTEKEGWNEINFINMFYRENFLESLYENLMGFDQSGEYHTEDLKTHTDMTVEHIKQHNPSGQLIEAGKYHDLGKLYTKIIDEETGDSHFYGHEKASAYLYLCGSVSNAVPGPIDDKTIYIAQLIGNHMLLHQKDVDIGKAVEKIGIKPEVKDDFIEDLKIINEADRSSSISRNQLRNMSLLEYVNTFPNWKEMIRKKPLKISVCEADGYCILMYNRFKSDMTYRIPMECRGHILKKVSEKYEYVCRPFDKFFNHGEEGEARLDINTLRATEKIDGSLCKVWYDDGRWHLSTNGMIDAFKAYIGEEGKKSTLSYGLVFERSIQMPFDKWCEINRFDKNVTYMFEMTSLDTQVVIPYNDGVYFLAARETKTGKEILDKPDIINCKYPREFNLKSMEDSIRLVREFSKNEEGLVLSDAYGNRVKVKSPEYLVAAHVYNNGQVSNKEIIELIKQSQIDDYEAYCLPELPDDSMPPEQFAAQMARRERIKEKIADVVDRFDKCVERYENAWEKVKEYDILSNIDFAAKVSEYKESPFLFEKHRNPSLTAADYLKKCLTSRLMREMGLKEEKEQRNKNDMEH